LLEIKEDDSFTNLLLFLYNILNLQNMAKSNTPQTLMAATKSAINKAKYHTTQEKKDLAIKLLTQLMSEVEALEIVKPKAKSAKPKNINKMTKAQLIELINKG